MMTEVLLSDTSETGVRSRADTGRLQSSARSEDVHVALPIHQLMCTFEFADRGHLQL